MNSMIEAEYKYLVCVRCYTFNQSRYITDALNGFVMQQTNFPFVCCIVDDASTDGEQDVIKLFVSKNFDSKGSSATYDKDADYGHVTFAQHKTNKNCFFAVIYLNENHYRKKSKAPYIKEWNDHSKYIALCEGDDYWTDPLKLQKQVDYMESHYDCCMCCHAAEWEVEGRLELRGCQHAEECDLRTEEIIKEGGLHIATASLVYQAKLGKDRPEWRRVADVGDFPLQILGTLRGKLHFFPETMCVYRFMREGSWTGSSYGSNTSKEDMSLKHTKNKVLWLGLLDEETGGKYTKAIHSYLFPYYNELFNTKQISFLTYFKNAMKADERHGKRVFKDFLILCFKPLYSLWVNHFKDNQH